MRRDGILCFEHEELHVSCTEWVRGEALPGRIRHRETAAQVGRLLGLLHNYETSANPAAHPLIGFSHPTSLSEARKTHETPGRDKEVLHLLDLKSELARGRDISAAIEHRRVRDGVAHGDVHPANIVRFRNDLALIDWESLRAEGQWYERLRVILWCLYPTPWMHGFDRDLLKAFADAYVSEHRVEHWDWAEDVEDFTTLLLIDGGPYVADASPRTKAFARDRLRLAQWLAANRLSVIEAIATLFGKKTRHAR
jgi:Ser/Thr protein kinase RdoA (MazF antagonist)